MGSMDLLEIIHKAKIIAVVRGDSTAKVLKAVDAIVDGGVSVIEITFTNEDPCKLIECNTGKSDRIVGAGTVLNVNQAKSAVAAGAKFIVSPCIVPEVINYCLNEGVLVLPGVFTPTEVYTALQLGAQVLKLFPGSIGGIEHMKTLKGPFPNIKIVPTGGVDKTNIAKWLQAGALAVGLGSNLAPKNLIDAEDHEGLKQLAAETIAAANT